MRGSDARAARDLADWLAALEHAGKADRTRYQYALTALDLAEAYPDKGITDFTDGDILHLIRGYPKAGRPTREAHLRSLFKWARRTRRIDENPFEFIEPARHRKPRLPDVFTEAEESALCGLPSPDGELLTIMFQTGIRRDECCKLQWRHVNLKHGELAILESKGDKDRIVPLTPLALAALVDLEKLEGLDREDFLWYSKPGGAFDSRLHSRKIAWSSFARWWSRCIEAAGVTHRKPHMTRHTRATRMRRMGYDIDEIQKFLGHASSETTSNLYVHTDIYDVARRMAELEGAGV